jgi:hypothetical protein
LKKLAKSIKANSFLSMKLNYEHWRRSKHLDLKNVFKTDFRLLHNIMTLDEFFLGVKSLLIDRSKEPTNW